MKVEKVLLINELAQEFMEPPKVERRGKDYLLKYDYESELGGYQWTGITFKNVFKYRHTPDNLINVDMVKAYNAVGIVNQSTWLKEEKFNQLDGTIYKHYLIYFDGFGAYEFLCTEFSKGIN